MSKGAVHQPVAGHLGTPYPQGVGDLVERAARLAEKYLAEALPSRWRHVSAVGRKAEQVAEMLAPQDAEMLAAAAWLHDLGYAPDLVETGFHPLDGARWLRQKGFDQRLCSLVAHHSCAQFEASERGLGEELGSEFAQERSATADALWYVDLTTGPEGQDFDVLERLAEIRARYGPHHLVTRVWARAEPTAIEAVRRTEARLAGQPM